jgi:nucleoside 2-deoxyribosyltransferase
MKVMVCGPIGGRKGGKERIIKIQKVLRSEGIDVLNQFEKVNYGEDEEFNDIKKAKEVVKHDLSLLNEADVVITIADEPSFGTGVEVCEAKKRGKIVVALAKEKVKSPWPLAYCDYFVKSIDELLEVIKRLNT